MALIKLGREIKTYRIDRWHTSLMFELQTPMWVAISTAVQVWKASDGSGRVTVREIVTRYVLEIQ